MFKLNNKSKKLMKALSLGIVSLGLLAGIGMSANNTNVNARSTKKVRVNTHKQYHKKQAKKHITRKHRAKRTKRVKKHATHKAKNYDYLGTYKQGERQARKDSRHGYPSFNHLIKNRKLLSNKYMSGYSDGFYNHITKDDSGSEEFGVTLSAASAYLSSNNKITKEAYRDFYGHNVKPNKYLMKHNKHYKKVFNSLSIY